MGESDEVDEGQDDLTAEETELAQMLERRKNRQRSLVDSLADLKNRKDEAEAVENENTDENSEEVAKVPEVILDTNAFLEMENTTVGDDNNVVSLQEAFASDDVTNAFIQEKQAEIDENIAGRLNNSTVPGWGAWTGPDTAKPLSRRALRRKTYPGKGRKGRGNEKSQQETKRR